jgi:hypothetical protein
VPGRGHGAGDVAVRAGILTAMTSYQFVGRTARWTLTGCADCAAALIASAEDPTAMAQAFAERGPPPPERTED